MTSASAEATGEQAATTDERLDAAVFDQLHELVTVALAQRTTRGTAYFEIHADTELHGLWLCGRCGVNTQVTPCARHDSEWIVPGYFENWTLTDQGAAIGQCGPCANADTVTAVTTAICTEHGHRRVRET